MLFFFFFNDTATTEIYTLSLHDALPIFATAEAGFRALTEREERDAQTIRATYFLARTLMKTGRFDEASALLIRIYSMDQAFYDTWNGDFLLGECRKALGK